MQIIVHFTASKRWNETNKSMVPNIWTTHCSG